MLRQVTEPILIKELNPELNTKDEWGNSNALRERDRIGRDNLQNFFKEEIMRTRIRPILSDEVAEVLAWLKCPQQPLSRGTLVHRRSTSKILQSLQANK